MPSRLKPAAHDGDAGCRPDTKALRIVRFGEQGLTFKPDFGPG